MSDELRQSIVRIWRQGQVEARVVGVGFLVTDRHVVTCAHVVSSSLLGTLSTSELPPGQVPIDFPLLDAPRTVSQARVVFWGPTDGMGDIAVLEPDGIPSGVRPVRLANVPNLFRHRFRAFGFPDVKEGRWAVGELLDREASGWVQLQNLDVAGYRIQPGYSGGPVWDDELECVVGMVVASVSGDAANSLRTGFAIPTALLVKAWPRAGNLLVTSDQDVISFLVRGVTALPVNYAGRIQNFFEEYLGTPVRPVPFGGRKDSLTRLDQWFEDASQPPYLLMAAPAGRGKSALLVHWCCRVFQRQDCAVVFVPVSVRFNTNLESVVFAVATARLAALHGDKTPGEAHTSAEMWRALMTDYLRRPLPDGRRLLVVLDGLDEAAGWEARSDLFPQNPPPGLRVVVSARPSAGEVGATPWLRRLGWDREGRALSLELDVLTAEGVADAVARMGFPLDSLGGRVDIIAQLHRLSEGEPLLVRLYADVLWSRGEEAARLTPDDLQKIPPGLEAYLNRWWDDQRQLWGPSQPLREPQVRFFLKLLTFALGPLRKEDVLSLTPAEVGLDGLLLDEAIRPLARLVIGDGREQGYTFSHPRLGLFFSEKWKEDREAMQDRFLNWGRQTVTALSEGRLAPGDASSYVVQYFGVHLEGTHADPDTLLSLVSDGWRRAWEALEGSFSGFLTDIERVWHAITRLNQARADAGEALPLLAAEVLCALCKASINSVSQNIPPELLEALVKQGIWTPGRGFAHARQVPNPLQRTRSLARVSQYLLDPQKLDAQAEAVAAARGIGNEYLRAEALAALAPHLAGPLLVQALDAARGFAEEHERAWVLGKLAAHLPESLQRPALSTARAIGNEYHRAEALASLAPHLPGPLLVEALDAVREFEEENERAWVLGMLAAHLPESLQRPALATARAIENEYHRAEALANLAPHLSESLLAQALEAARGFDDEGERVYALGSVARHLSTTEQNKVLTEALAVARGIKDETRRAWALGQLAPQLPGPLLTEALDVAHKIQGAAEQATALSSLAPHLPLAVREEVLTRALAAARALGDARARQGVLEELAPQLPEALDAAAWAKLLAAVLAIPNNGTQNEALAALTPDMTASRKDQTLRPAPGVPNQAILSGIASRLPGPLLVQVFNAVRQRELPNDWEKLLPALGPYLPESALRGALTAASSRDYEQSRARALAALAPYLPAPLLAEALDAARRIEGADERAEALAALAPYLAKPLRDEALREALTAAPGIRYQGKWKPLLSALAPYLHGPLLGQALTVARGIKKASLQDGVSFDSIMPLNALPTGDSGLDERADGLAALAPYLPKPLLVEAVAATRALEDWDRRARALAALAPYLPGPLLAEAEAAARSIGDAFYRAWLLTELARNLPKSVRASELAAAHVFLSENQGPFLFEELFAYNPMSHFASDLAAARNTRDSEERAAAWAALALRLPALIWQGVWPEALGAARRIRNKAKRIAALAELSIRLPEPTGSEVWTEAMHAARNIKDESDRVKTLAVIDRCVRGPLLNEELAAARHIEEGFAKARALAVIAPRLPQSQRAEVMAEALAAARVIEDSGLRIGAFMELSHGFAGIGVSELHVLWGKTLPVLARRSRVQLLIDLWALQPFLSRMGGPEMFAGTFRVVHAVGQWWP